MLPVLTASSVSLPLDPSRLPAVEVPGLYVHVPFCFHKCHYCDFYSITRQTPERMARYVDLVLREADRWLAAGTVRIRPRTVFFGGGTPSLLPLDEMRRLLAGLRARFDFSDLIEWTIECNPATVEAEYCSMLFETGVDRLSFGAQSFRPEELAILERHHDPADVPRSIEIARAAGFRRLSVDLIYAVPGQDLASWQYSLDSALALGTSHLSCYGLTYESNTPMAVKKRLGQFRGAEESLELEMLHFTRSRLTTVGLPPYEISNYAAPGEECRHNLLYWDGGSYIGLGPSAASHVEGHRWRNRPHLGEWETAVAGEHLPAIDVEELSPLRRAGELAYLRMRLRDGINYADFASRTGYDARNLYGDEIARLSREGLLISDDCGVRLSETGVNVADAIGAVFLAPTE